MVHPIVNQRDDLRVELDRYYSLPNIVGVGMGLEQTLESLPTGGTVKTTKVSGLAPGQSADLSGAIKIGDDLLEVSICDHVVLVFACLHGTQTNLCFAFVIFCQMFC